MNKLIKLISNHKIVSAIVLVVLVYGGYRWYISSSGGNVGVPRYVLQTVERGTLVTSVSGTGQISASNQFDVKSNVSGNIVLLGVSEGQNISAGILIAQLDATNAQKTVRDAEINLESAQLNFQQLQLSSVNMDKILSDAFTSISNTFLTLPGIINDAQQAIISDDLNPKSQTNNDFYKNFVAKSDDVNSNKISLLVDSAYLDYMSARSDYDETFISYKNIKRNADQTAIEALLKKTIKSVTSAAQALKSEQNVIDFLIDYSSTANNSKKIPTIMTTYRSTIKTDISLTNSSLSDLVSVDNSIQNAPLSIQSQELSIKQKENALADAKTNLNDYYIRAPFSGIVAKLNVKNGDPISGSTVVATMINFQKLAQISLNEVDVSKIKIGQKATLSFDALPNLTLTGRVAEIDTIGTVSQGVVTYNVKIAVDANDSNVKPGMSVSASIITDVKKDVLIVPNSAVKSAGNSYYVEILDGSASSSSAPAGQGVVSAIPPRRVSIGIGSANDSMTEITSGLKEGDVVVSQTISASAQTTQAQQNSAFRIPGIGGGGGGGGGILRTGAGGR